MRFGDKQLAALHKAAHMISSQLGMPRGMDGADLKALGQAVAKMSTEIQRRAKQKRLREEEKQTPES